MSWALVDFFGLAWLAGWGFVAGAFCLEREAVEGEAGVAGRGFFFEAAIKLR